MVRGCIAPDRKNAHDILRHIMLLAVDHETTVHTLLIWRLDGGIFSESPGQTKARTETLEDIVFHVFYKALRLQSALAFH